MHREKIHVFLILFILGAGCMGEEASPVQTEQKTQIPTQTPTPSTSRPTMASPTIPPTSPPVTSQTPTPVNVIYHANLAGAPEGSEEYGLLEIFIEETNDDDSSDEQLYVKLDELADKTGVSANILMLRRPVEKAKLTEEALEYIPIDGKTKKKLFEYWLATNDTDTILLILLTKDYAIVFFGPDNKEFNMATKDRNAVLNVTGCHKYNSNACKPIRFLPGEGAWFYIIPRKSGHEMLGYLKSLGLFS